MVVAVVVAPAVERLASAWGHGRTHPAGRPDLMSHLRELPSGGLFVLLGLLVLLVAVNLRSPVTWPRVALAGTVPMAAFEVLAELVDLAVPSGDHGAYLAWLAGGGVAAAILAWGAARLACLVVTRPVTADVIRSNVDITFPLRDGSRLRAQGGKLLLDLLPEPAVKDGIPALRLAIPYQALVLVQSGVLDTHALQWPLPNGSAITLSPGPALRIVGSGQQWLVPVDDAASAAAIVTERARANGGLAAPPGMSPGKVPEVSESLSTKRVRPWRTSPWPLDVAVVAAFALAGVSVDYAVTEEPLGWITVGLCLCGVAGGVRLVRRIRAARDQNEANPRPANAEPWGDYTPTRTPMAGWSPAAAVQS